MEVRSGSGFSEERMIRGVAAALDAESFPGCPPGPSPAGMPGVVLQARVDGVADPALEGAECFLAGLALSDLPVVVGAALAVLVGIWVTAAMWMAWLSRRLLRRDSR